MLQHLPFILRNTLRNRRRSVLTVMSMAVSLCLLGLLLSLYLAFFHAPDASPAAALRLVVRHRVSLTQILPVSYKQRIASIPHVVGVSNWQWFGGTYKDARDPRNFFARFVVDPVDVLKTSPDISMPEEQKQAFIRQRTGAIASTALVEKHGWKLGERITLVGDIFPVTLELRLVGIFEDPEDGQVMLFSWEYLQQALLADAPDYRDAVGSFRLLVDAPENVPGVAQTIDAMFANSPYPTKTESEKELALSFIAFLGNLRLFLLAVCSAVTFTILLVSANTVAMAVRERTRETGILRTVGFTPSEILVLILSEAAMLGVIGGLAGAGLSYLLSMWMRAFLQDAGGFPFPLLSATMASLLVGASVIISVMSAAVPAWFASRRNVVESMRFTG